VFAEIVRVLHRYEPVHILCDSEDVRETALQTLLSHAVDLGRCRMYVVPTDRAWLRDTGPTAVLGSKGLEWICWTFNGWAKYDNYSKDAAVAGRIAEISGLPTTSAMRPDGRGPLVLEGGGIESNGAGALLVTEEWLLSDVQVRNSGLGREGYERAFAEYLGTTRTIWLGEGAAGDDTHGHVDDIARFVDRRTVVLATEADPDDDNCRRMKDNRRRLEVAGQAMKGNLRIVELPFPRPVVMEGERLPASYANFYVANGVVIVPTFNDPNDRTALATLSGLFPGREIVGIHAVDLVWGLGTLHCLTQQEPVAVGAVGLGGGR
jgi:agmatine deiminase